LPHSSGSSHGGAGEEHCRWPAVAGEQPRELFVVRAAERVLVHDDQTDGSTFGLNGPNPQGGGEAACADGVVTNLPERGTKEGARPLIGHYDEHTGRKKGHTVVRSLLVAVMRRVQ
jgi:hypothetical protein